MIDPTIELLRDRLVSALAPRRTILFGSRARGTAQPESDYDILVVAETELERVGGDSRISGSCRTALARAGGSRAARDRQVDRMGADRVRGDRPNAFNDFFVFFVSS